MRILRDGRVVEEKVNGNEERYYKYVNNDPSISKIIVNLNTISGVVDLFGQRKDFRASSEIPLIVEKGKINALTVKDNVTEPLYLKVQGLVNSIYTIGIRTEHEDHPFSSSITLSEDVEYKFKLAPG